MRSFVEHADKIDIIVPAWYSVDGNGLVWGSPNPRVLKTAADHLVPVMPSVPRMIQAKLHKLLSTDASKTAFIHALLNERKKNGYTGFQIDFENVNWTDRDLLSGLIAETAVALHLGESRAHDRHRAQSRMGCDRPCVLVLLLSR